MVKLSFKNMLLYTASETTIAVVLINDMEKRAREMLPAYIEEQAKKAGLV